MIRFAHSYGFFLLLLVGSGASWQGCKPPTSQGQVEACLKAGNWKYSLFLTSLDSTIKRSSAFNGEDPYYNVYVAARDEKYTFEERDIWPFRTDIGEFFEPPNRKLIGDCIRSTGLNEEGIKVISKILNQPYYYDMNGRFDETAIKEFSDKFCSSEIAPILYEYLIFYVIVRTHIVTELPPHPSR